VAGHILDDIVLGSIEYAVQNLRTPLVMVLGHSDCGAVRATVAGTELKGHLSSIASAIQPAVNGVKNFAGDIVEHAVHANALNVAEQIRSASPILTEFIQNGKVTVVAAKYHLQTGLVEIL
jgi:carbonic anhydrase